MNLEKLFALACKKQAEVVREAIKILAAKGIRIVTPEEIVDSDPQVEMNYPAENMTTAWYINSGHPNWSDSEACPNTWGVLGPIRGSSPEELEAILNTINVWELAQKVADSYVEW